MHYPQPMGTSHPSAAKFQTRNEPLRVPVLIDRGSSWLRAYCHEISQDCLQVGDESLALGELVELYLELPTRIAIEARASVVQVEAGLATLQFVGLEPDALRAIAAYCRTSGLQRRISGTFQPTIPDPIVLP